MLKNAYSQLVHSPPLWLASAKQSAKGEYNLTHLQVIN